MIFIIRFPSFGEAMFVVEHLRAVPRLRPSQGCSATQPV
jgi:hypothetical protein